MGFISFPVLVDNVVLHPVLQFIWFSCSFKRREGSRAGKESRERKEREWEGGEGRQGRISRHLHWAPRTENSGQVTVPLASNRGLH